MKRTGIYTLVMVAGSLGTCLAGAPATPSYVNIEAAIEKVEQDWAAPGATVDPNAPGWNALFDSIRKNLTAYTNAKTEAERLVPLGRLYGVSRSLDSVAWAPAVSLRDEMRIWLRPRVLLSWASRHLTDSVSALPATADESALANRDRWVEFVGTDLGSALHDYEAASDIRARRAALARVYGTLEGLEGATASWGPATELQSALNDLFNGPNLQATADAASVSPKLANFVVESGPITRNGQTAYVTAGPYMGFGLMASDDGIMFFNRQALSSVTPIRGFQQEVASDPQGEKAAKLYQFGATSTDQSVLTVIAVLRPTGIQFFPQSTHNINATVSSAPQPGKGFPRAIASLIGLGKNKITDKVYEAAIPEIRQQVREGSREEALERTAERAAQTNAQLAQVFVDPDTLAVKNFEVDDLHLRSRPQFVIVDGTLKWRGADEQVGAEMPKPAKFLEAAPGVAADVHLASIMTNLTRGYLQQEPAQKVENLMIVTHKIPPGAPAKDAVTVSQNVDFAKFLEAVQDARLANDPKVQALRVKKPGRAPEFTVDRNGFLVAIVHDFSIEVPAPEAAAKGGIFGPAARVYRLEAPDAAVSISFQVEPATNDLPIRLTGRVEDFDSGPGAKVYAINDDESKAEPLTDFTGRAVLGVFAGKVKGQPIDVPLGDLKIPGFALSSVSKVDPSGWMRVILTPQANAPAAAATAPALPDTSASVPVAADSPTTGEVQARRD